MNITPGPWRSTRHSHNMVKVENKDRVIFDGFHGEEGNALLAAAAPELLQAVIDLLAIAPSKAPAAGLIVGIEEKHAAAILSAKAAIKKATQSD